jgi:hypothetical protein
MKFTIATLASGLALALSQAAIAKPNAIPSSLGNSSFSAYPSILAQATSPSPCVPRLEAAVLLPALPVPLFPPGPSRALSRSLCLARAPILRALPRVHPSPSTPPRIPTSPHAFPSVPASPRALQRFPPPPHIKIGKAAMMK